jgi:hypothetical protein
VLIGVIAVSTVILLGGAMLWSRTFPWSGPPVCPNCRVPYQVLTDPPGDGARRTYEVLACLHCANTSTRVHGSPSRFAYCPACTQRTLETPVKRLPPSLENPLQVEVDERCHVCGYEDVRVVPPPWSSQRGRGKVIPFPARPR